MSALENPTTPANLQKARVFNMIAIRTSQSGTSSVTDNSMDSRMSAIEQCISSMEKTITQSFNTSIVKIIEKMSSTTPASITTQPPGGELAGRDDE